MTADQCGTNQALRRWLSSASQCESVIASILNSWLRNLVSSAVAHHPTPTTSSSQSSGPWGARSAINSPFPFAGCIIANSIGAETNAHGGNSKVSSHWLWLLHFGRRRMTVEEIVDGSSEVDPREKANGRHFGNGSHHRTQPSK